MVVNLTVGIALSYHGLSLGLRLGSGLALQLGPGLGLGCGPGLILGLGLRLHLLVGLQLGPGMRASADLLLLLIL